jgi:hypothetical protein
MCSIRLQPWYSDVKCPQVCHGIELSCPTVNSSMTSLFAWSGWDAYQWSHRVCRAPTNRRRSVEGGNWAPPAVDSHYYVSRVRCDQILPASADGLTTMVHEYFV